MYVLLPVIYPFSYIFKMFKYSCLVQKVVEIHLMSVYVLLFVSTYIYHSVIYISLCICFCFLFSVSNIEMCLCLTDRKTKQEKISLSLSCWIFF